MSRSPLEFPLNMSSQSLNKLSMKDYCLPPPLDGASARCLGNPDCSKDLISDISFELKSQG